MRNKKIIYLIEYFMTTTIVDLDNLNSFLVKTFEETKLKK